MTSAKKLAALCAVSWLACVQPVAAQVAISQLPSGTALTGGEYVPVVQSGTTVKTTPAAIATYVLGAGAIGTTGSPSAGDMAKFSAAATITTATPGTDYVAPGTATNFTATQALKGSSSQLAASITNAAEPATLSATAAAGTINLDVTTQSVLYYTTAATANWTMNLRGNAGATLNSLMAVGQAVTVVFLATQGSTAYYASALTIDGTAVTPLWQGGNAPAAGNPNGVDAYTFTVIKTAASTYTVLASLTQF